MSHLKDFLFFFRPFLKLTEHSKYPTDHQLDLDKELLKYYLQPVKPLFMKIIKEHIKRFFKYRWKRFVGWVFIIALAVSSSYFVVKWYVEPIVSHPTSAPIKKTVYIRTLRTFDQFIDAVAQREASGDWGTVSKDSMLGAFQFDPFILRNVLGIQVRPEDFLQNKELQIGAFKQLLLSNYRSYYKYVSKWRYKTIKNVDGTITESGILMAFHLRPSSARIFFDSEGINLGNSDGNGVYINEYIERFSGYEIPFIK